MIFEICLFLLQATATLFFAVTTTQTAAQLAFAIVHLVVLVTQIYKTVVPSKKPPHQPSAPTFCSPQETRLANRNKRKEEAARAAKMEQEKAARAQERAAHKEIQKERAKAVCPYFVASAYAVYYAKRIGVLSDNSVDFFVCTGMGVVLVFIYRPPPVLKVEQKSAV